MPGGVSLSALRDQEAAVKHRVTAAEGIGGHGSRRDREDSGGAERSSEPEPGRAGRRRWREETGVGDLHQQVQRLTQALEAERARADDLDQRLGYALLTAGRLRGQLRQHGLEPDARFPADTNS